jgi:hypothetical protein
MNDDVTVIQALMSRRSIRAFLPDPVEEIPLVSKREDVDDFVHYLDQ